MNPANALSQLSPGMAECHARLMVVAKHGTTEAFSATLAGVLQRAELSISNAYDAGAKSIRDETAAPSGVTVARGEGDIAAAITSSRDAFFAHRPHLVRTEANEQLFAKAFELGADYVGAAFSAKPTSVDDLKHG